MENQDQDQDQDQDQRDYILARMAKNLEPPSAEEVAEQAERARRNRELDASEKWDPANPRGLRVATMSQAEFNGWHAAGCPPLEPGATTLPATPEKRASGLPVGAFDALHAVPSPEPPGGEIASQKWVVSQLDTLARATGAGLGKFTKAKLAPVLAEIEQNHRAYEAVGRVVDRLSNELAELKREAALQKRLAEQNVKRRVDLLELENSILRAGRRPDEVEEAEIPKMEWNGHAQ